MLITSTPARGRWVTFLQCRAFFRVEYNSNIYTSDEKITSTPPPRNTTTLRHKNGPEPHQGPRLALPPELLLYKEGTLTKPSPHVKEAILGFTPGDAAAQGLDALERQTHQCCHVAFHAHTKGDDKPTHVTIQ